jgi:hypothetical protein
MIINEFVFDSPYNQEPKHGFKPLCAFCSGDIDVMEMDNSWYWFVDTGKVYYAHAECGQNNINPLDAEGFADWLGSVQKNEDEGGF